MLSLSTVSKRLKHSLPDLPYDYNALEPIISAEIMQVHHGKHHQTYVNNLNVAEEKFAEAKKTGCLQSIISAQNAVSFNGGGHINHSIFWQNLTPLKTAKKSPSGDLGKAITDQFGNFEEFIKLFNAKAVAVQGSGWGWLGYNPQMKRVEIATTANQDLLLSRGLIPLLAVDVWEHAYYLQYKNMRGDFLKNIWQIINWDDVSNRYNLALKGQNPV